MLPFAFTGLNLNAVKLLGIGLVITFILYKWYDYTSTIDNLTNKLQTEIQSHNLTKSEALIYQADIDRLKITIEDQNRQITNLSIARDKAITDYNNYKNLPISSRLNNDEIKILLDSDPEFKKTCEYGLKLNKEISKLKYKDL